VERDVVTSSYAQAASAFLETYLDDYWRGYRPAWTYNNKKNHKQKNSNSNETLQSNCFKSLFHDAPLPPLSVHHKSSLGSSIDESIFYRCTSDDEGNDDMEDEKDFSNDYEVATTMATSLTNSISFDTTRSFDMFQESAGNASQGDLSSHFLSSDDQIDHHNLYETKTTSFRNTNHNSISNDERSLVHGHLVLVPQDWMLTQSSSSSDRQFFITNNNSSNNNKQGTLSCPNCGTMCGYWQKEALSLLGDFNLCDLFALQESSVRMKRRIRVKAN